MHHNHRAEKSASRYTEMRFARQALVLLLHELWQKLRVLTVDGLEQTKIPPVQSQDGVDVVTVCVTCWRAERGLGLRAGFRLGVDKARKTPRIPPVRCTLCWAAVVQILWSFIQLNLSPIEIALPG